MSEYVPYFRKRPELMERFKLRYRIDALGEMLERRSKSEEEMRRQISGDEVIPVERSSEYCSQIIHSMETGTPRRVNANVRNEGLITNLPEGSCVEVPCLVDKGGVHPCFVGDLPPQCAGLNRTNINVHEIGVLAAVEKEKELVFQSLLLDPLTCAMLTIEETRKMVEEMFEAEALYLSGFK
jgi:alpha-galactosidase